jgi:hypothetical protein
MNQEMERGVVGGWAGGQGLTSACAEGDSRPVEGSNAKPHTTQERSLFVADWKMGVGNGRGHSPSASSVLSDCSGEDLRLSKAAILGQP